MGVSTKLHYYVIANSNDIPSILYIVRNVYKNLGTRITMQRRRVPILCLPACLPARVVY